MRTFNKYGETWEVVSEVQKYQLKRAIRELIRKKEIFSTAYAVLEDDKTDWCLIGKRRYY